jgi:hypothetical protein
MESQETLFDFPENKNDNSAKLATCNTCEHRQRWQCNSKVFQYCGVRKSNRTTNGLLKIKCKDLACPLYKITDNGNNDKNYQKKE